jgi:subtilisin-like proprotein convertase family protein
LALSSALAQTTVTNTFTGLNKVIPDGQATGVSDTEMLTFTNQNFSDITDLKVMVTISGGFNGDYYAYLVHDSGFAVLLNRTGMSSTNSLGYSDTGFDVTFADSGQDIHFYQNFPYNLNGNGQLTGTWAPDGRNVDPSQVSENDSPSALLGSFNGTDPNGGWTLFLADLSPGEEGTLVSWGLDISAVPEPSTGWLAALGALVFTFGVLRRGRSWSDRQK